MKACRCNNKAQRLRLVSTICGGPSPLPLSHPGEGFFQRLSEQTIAMPLYFAYGLNMDLAGMAQRCPRSQPLGLARLPRHRFIVTTDGYASVIRDPREEVHGVLWDCTLGDIRTLDKFEELASGLYVKISQPVIVTGGTKRALVYIGRSGTIGKPKPGYMETVIASAKHWALPEAYIAGMNRFLSKPTSDLKTLEQNTGERLAAGPVAGVRARAAAPHSTVPLARPPGRKDDDDGS